MCNFQNANVPFLAIPHPPTNPTTSHSCLHHVICAPRYSTIIQVYYIIRLGGRSRIEINANLCTPFSEWRVVMVHSRTAVPTTCGDKCTCACMLCTFQFVPQPQPSSLSRKYSEFTHPRRRDLPRNHTWIENVEKQQWHGCLHSRANGNAGVNRCCTRRIL